MVLTDTEDAWNRPDLWSAELPAANGITNARSLARFYAGLSGTVEGGPAEPLLDAAQVAAACTLHTSGPDQVLMMMETTFGPGFFTASEIARYGGTAAFGHNGAGASTGFTDSEHGLSFGYVLNRMGLGLNIGRAHV